MKIFISWSGDRSKILAEELKLWLGSMLVDDVIFMSQHDIAAGTRWGQKLGEELGETDFGIVCLTPENVSAEWLMFEAGALSKVVESSRVIPYLLGLGPAEVKGPLSQFQAIEANEQGSMKLLQSINGVRTPAISEEVLARMFRKWWPDLEQQIFGIPKSIKKEVGQRDAIDMLEEILLLLRGQAQDAQQNKSEFSFLTHEELGSLTIGQLINLVATYKEKASRAKSPDQIDVAKRLLGMFQVELDRRIP